ncbi:HNH endonuclease signature motif containing protein [Microbacterium tumbae]
MAIFQNDRTQRAEALRDDWERVNAEIAALEAERAALLAERLDLLLEEDPFGSVHHDVAVRSLSAEYAASAHLSHGVVEGALFRSHTLVKRYPRTWRALADGAITPRHAEMVVQGASSLIEATEEQRAEYEARALDVALADSPGRTLAAAKMIAAAIAPASVAERHRAARELRGARVQSLDDGMGHLGITASELLTRACFDRATQMAKQVISQRPGGGSPSDEADTRTLDQIRSDIMIELLLAADAGAVAGTPAEAITATVQVTIAASTLVGDDDLMAELDGFGPALPEDVRTLAGHASSWSRLFLSPGGMPSATDSYTPTAAMKRLLRARDQRCRFPGCRRAAARCEIDHNHDHAKGGRTEIGNLSCFCTGHHTLKHPDLLDRHRWSARHLPGGVIAWISPEGSTYIDEPPRRVAFV